MDATTRRSAPVPSALRDVSAISFDFYDTLAVHGPDRGRGRRLMAYFADRGWRSDVWAYEVLHDVFLPHGRDFDPDAGHERHREFCERVALTLFERLAVQAPDGAARSHALDIWNILGPNSLTLFPDTTPTLSRLKAAGYKLVVTSNWQCGLGGFCRAMGIGGLFDHVIASAEVGAEKPDRLIFDDVCRRLKLEPSKILHVGDTIDADYEGARNAGFHAVVIDRYGKVTDTSAPVVADLPELARLLGVA
jgi:HAD superfamily hydrolase (TIGR01509 family)